MKLGLRRKLIRGFAIILFAVAALALVNLYTARTIQTRLQDAVRLDVAAASILTDVSTQVGLVHAHTLLHVQSTSSKDMELYVSRITDGEAEISSLLNAFENALPSQHVLPSVGEFRFAWSLYSGLRDELLLPASTANRKQEALSLVAADGAAAKAAQAAFDALRELQEAATAAANDHLVLVAQQQRNSQIILVALTILAIAPALIFSMHVSSEVVDSIRIMSSAAQLVADGDADWSVTLDSDVADGDADWSVTLDSDDELQRMAESFSTITRRMRKLRAASHEATQNLRQEAEERRHAQEMLSIERESLAMTLDSVGQGVITTDHEGKVALINSTAAEIIGWDQHIAAGKPLDDMLHILDGTARTPRENPLETTLSGAATHDPNGPVTLVNKSGTERKIVFSAAPLRDKDGGSGGTFLVLRLVPDNDEPKARSSRRSKKGTS